MEMEVEEMITEQHKDTDLVMDIMEVDILELSFSMYETVKSYLE